MQSIHVTNVTNIQYKRKKHLVRHTTSQHTNQRHTCDQCGKQFKRREHLKRHTITEHTNTRYLCLQPIRKAIQKNRKNERTSEKELYQHQIINCIFYHDFFLASNICTIR